MLRRAPNTRTHPDRYSRARNHQSWLGGRWLGGKLLYVLIVGYAALLIPAVSYVQALLYLGHASVLERSVDWLEDHGGGPLVDTIENWWRQR